MSCAVLPEEAIELRSGLFWTGKLFGITLNVGGRHRESSALFSFTFSSVDFYYWMEVAFETIAKVHLSSLVYDCQSFPVFSSLL